MTPVDRLTTPAAPWTGLPVLASSCTRKPLVVEITIRGRPSPLPGQYEIPRPPAEGFGPIPGMSFRSNFQSSVPASAFSATMFPWTGKYMTLLTTIGVTVYPEAGTPMS